MAATQWLAQNLTANGIVINYYQSVAPPSLSLAPNAPALPILVFLHAMWLTGAYLVNDVADLTTAFTVVLPDARCHGLSKPVPEGTFLTSNLVSDAAALISHVGNGEPVYLMGTSMGAATAARVAKAYPNLVKAVVIEEAPWTRFPGVLVDAAGAEVGGGTEDLVQYLQAMSDEEFAQIDSDGAALTWPAESRLKAWRAFDVADCVATLGSVDAGNNEGVDGILVPTLLQMGDAKTTGGQVNGSKTDPAVAEYVIKTYPQGQLSFYEGGNHVLHEAPTAAKWLKEVLWFFGRFA